MEIQEVSCLGRCDSAPAGAINHIPVAPANLVDAVQLEADLERPGTTPQQPLAPKPRRWKCDPYADPAMLYTTVRALSADPATIGVT